MYLSKNFNWLNRTELLIGQEKLNNLKQSHVLVVGLGGVGAYSAEILARAGIGELTIVDGDIIKESNRNRQLLALCSTENKLKANLMKDRLLDINPAIQVHTISKFIQEDDIIKILEVKYDYVVDAIDSITPKTILIVNTLLNKYPLISNMGAGGKIDPFKIKIDDISRSFNCPLARVIRNNLKKHGITTGFDVVFSEEPVNKKSVLLVNDEKNKKSTAGTISYIPAMFGMFSAFKVIQKLSTL